MRVAAVLLVLLAGTSSAAQAGGEFVSFAQTADLSEEQRDILQNLDADPTTAEISVIQANTQALSVIDGEVTMSLGIGAVATFPAERQSLGEVADGPGEGASFAWSADTVEGAAGDVASVAVVDGEVTGTVQIGEATFAFYSLGDGLTAVVQETADLPPDHPPELPEGALNTDVSDVNPDDLRDEADVSVARISVLVVATPAAKANFSSLLSLAEAAIEVSNTSFKNSGVNLQFELAGTHQLNRQRTSLNACSRAPGLPIDDKTARTSSRVIFSSGRCHWNFLRLDTMTRFVLGLHRSRARNEVRASENVTDRLVERGVPSITNARCRAS